MICERNVKIFCCEDISLIENYDKAIKDDAVWVTHHRLETHNSDGELRSTFISSGELKALGMYYKRPASELVLMLKSDHTILHFKGKEFSNEHKEKLSNAKKGYIPWNKGKKASAEARKRMSESAKGKKLSEETKRKMSDAHKGKKFSEEHRANIGKAVKGRKKTKQVKDKIGDSVSKTKAVYVKFNEGYILTTKKIAMLTGYPSGVVKQRIATYGYIIIGGKKKFCQLLT